jgi:hypothetical protein
MTDVTTRRYVYCEDAGDCGYLTAGKRYLASSPAAALYTIRDDDGDQILIRTNQPSHHTGTQWFVEEVRPA